MGYTATPVDGSGTPIPMSSVVPDGTNTPLALEGGPPITTGGNTNAPASMYVKDGNDIAQGVTTAPAATDSTSAWSVVALLKGIFGKLLGSIAVTGTFWQATQPVSGTVTANAGTNMSTAGLALDATLTAGTAKARPQVAGADVSLANPLPTVVVSQAGTIAPAAAQPNITSAGVDTAYTLSAQARRFLVQNNSGANASIELDAVTGAGSVVLLPGSTWTDPIEVTAFHFLTAGAVSINNGATGLIVKGWL